MLFLDMANGSELLPKRKDPIPLFFDAIAERFFPSNEGDVSPNTKGPHCPDGTPCETVHSTCGGRTEGCIASGPGKDDFESMQIIGQKQFEKAKELYDSAKKEIKVSVDYVHRFVDMEKVDVEGKWNADGQPAKTCIAALGDSFAGGTTDGPGDFTFTQGVNTTTANPYWNLLGSFIFPPDLAEIKCQKPKPILLNVGRFDIPSQWVGDILPLQIARIGDLVIVAVPGEFSTMSGRRLRNTVLETLTSLGAADNDTHVVIAGLSNDYSHYITTFEEFQYQRYEGASTLFGPHTLAAYQQEYSKLAVHLTKGTKPQPPYVYPADLSKSTIHIPFVLDFDLHPSGKPFGTVLQDIKGNATRGDLVTVVFQASNLRRNFRTEDTFIRIDKLEQGSWKTVRTDADFDNKLKWSNNMMRESQVKIEWQTSSQVQPGNYRIAFFGTAKSVSGSLSDYVGTSSSFYVN